MRSGAPPIPWETMKIEYETSDTSYKRLSDKYGVSRSGVEKRAKRENWTKERQTIASEIAQRTRQQFIANMSDKIATDMLTELESANAINALICAALKDKTQFARHLVQRKSKRSESGEGGWTEEDSWVEELDTTVLNTQRLLQAATALEKAMGVKRTILNFIDADKQEELNISRARLDIDRQNMDLIKQKLGLAAEDGELSQTGVIVLPDINVELMDNAVLEENRAIDTGRTVEATVLDGRERDD